MRLVIYNNNKMLKHVWEFVVLGAFVSSLLFIRLAFTSNKSGRPSLPVKGLKVIRSENQSNTIGKKKFNALPLISLKSHSTLVFSLKSKISRSENAHVEAFNVKTNQLVKSYITWGEFVDMPIERSINQTHDIIRSDLLVKCSEVLSKKGNHTSVLDVTCDNVKKNQICSTDVQMLL